MLRELEGGAGGEGDQCNHNAVLLVIDSPYTPQATYSGNTQQPRPLGSAHSTDCEHDQLSKQLQFGRGDL